MDSISASPWEVIPSDILCHVFEELIGDSVTLSSIGLVSKTWQSLSLPYLLRDVDLGSHNHGRLVPWLSDMDFLELDHSSTLVKQRAFLRLITEKPALAKYVRTLTWTLIWQDGDCEESTDLDRETWNVFSRLENVTTLDLAQCLGGEICTEPLIRQNPPRLFPKVTSLRLEGWMHRHLATAIVSTVDPRQLRVLKLDGLLDEGLLPDGHQMIAQVEDQYSDQMRDTRVEDLAPFDDLMIRRQEQRTTCSFQGPMWYPLHLLARQSLDSLAILDIQLSPLTRSDMRNYLTMFQAIASVLRTAKQTLHSVRIAWGESPQLYRPVDSGCGNARIGRLRYRRECIDMASIYLLYVLPVLCGEPFPQLTKLEFEGFRIIKDLGGPGNLDQEREIEAFQQMLPVPGVHILEKACVDCRWAQFRGLSDYHPHVESLEQYADIFRSS